MSDHIRFYAFLAISQVWAASSSRFGMTLALVWFAAALVSRWTEERA